MASPDRLRALVLAAMLIAPATARAQAPMPIAIERRLAEAEGLRVGDTVGVAASPEGAARRAVISAIYEPRPDPAAVARNDRRVRLHLPDLEALLGQPDRMDRAGVALLPGSDPAAVADRINAAAFGYRAHPSAEVARGSSRTFAVVSRFHRAIAVITIVASAVFLLCVMLLKVEERRGDVAVMRAIGVRRRTVFWSLVLEAVVLALAGSALGVAFGYAAEAVTNAYYSRYFDTALVFARVTPGILAFSLALSVLLGAAAGAAAAWRLVRLPPLMLWRRG